MNPGLVIAVLVGLATFSAVALAATPAVLRAVSSARRRAIDRAAPELRSEARVVDKRTHLTGGGGRYSEQRYFVTFQFPDGTRRELQLFGSDAGMLAVGDAGYLHWRGSRFLGFSRAIMR